MYYLFDKIQLIWYPVTTMNSSIQKTFKDTRKSYGKSQAEFAKILGCSRVSISLYETGKSEPGSDKYAKVLMLKAAIKNKLQGEDIATSWKPPQVSSSLPT